MTETEKLAQKIAKKRGYGEALNATKKLADKRA